MNTYDLIAAFQDQFGFDPQGVYCQFTGKKVGSFDDSEFDALVESLGDGDPEELIDDVAIRILASMRPSIRWNKMHVESLAEMRVSAPSETLAYLLNRMFAPLHWRKLGVEPMLGYYADRIKCYYHVESWGQTDATNTLLYMLLELDAKWNLDGESCPFNAYDFFFDAPTMEHRVSMLQQWYVRRIDAWEKKIKADEMQVAWQTSRTGNAIAKPAFRDAYMASSPPSKTAIAKQAKAEEALFFAEVFAEVMGVAKTVHIDPPSPVWVPIKVMPKKFGVKKS